MNTDCRQCVYCDYEPDTNYCNCKHVDYDEEQPDHCPIGGCYNKADAKADAKYSHSDKY